MYAFGVLQKKKFNYITNNLKKINFFTNTKNLIGAIFERKIWIESVRHLQLNTMLHSGGNFRYAKNKCERCWKIKAFLY